MGKIILNLIIIFGNIVVSSETNLETIFIQLTCDDNHQKGLATLRSILTEFRSWETQTYSFTF